MSLATWWIFVGVIAVLAIIPGPNMLHVMAMSVRLGFARATITMAGCLSAVLICVTASSLGLGAVLTASPTLFEALRWAGVAYLLWLSFKSWRAPAEPPLDAEGAAASDRALPAGEQYRTALFTGLSNPKLIVFSAAFFPQFIHPGAPWAPQFAILVATFAVIEVACYCLYAGGGRTLARWLRSAERRRLFNRVTGVLFLLFGLGLAAYRA